MKKPGSVFFLLFFALTFSCVVLFFSVPVKARTTDIRAAEGDIVYAPEVCDTGRMPLFETVNLLGEERAETRHAPRIQGDFTLLRRNAQSPRAR